MNVARLIAKKRDGLPLTEAEIGDLIAGYVDQRVPDYQMSAMAMAIYFSGMTTDETAALTQCMLNSGETLHWPDDGIARVDKHSTGGIGDNVSLVLGPLMAAAGLQVPMISGRGLGATGGTLDKLEAIPGFRTNLSLAEIRTIVAEVGCVISGATETLVPADRKLYALRDVTATIPSIPLITASIMSKKLAEGLDALVLDVKYGSGAFMKTFSDARALAEALVATGREMGVATTALITEMSQPLGRMAGNALEVNEAIELLHGQGPADLFELTLALGAELLVSAGREASREHAAAHLKELLIGGLARGRFEAMVTAQGGKLDGFLAVADAFEIQANRPGFIQAIDSELLGLAIIELGGGRRMLGDAIDPAVGLEFLVRVGDQVDLDTPLVRVFSRQASDTGVERLVRDAFAVGNDPVARPPLVHDRVG